MKATIEHQIFHEADGFDLILTISNNGNYWTSKPARLDATTWDEAHKEAKEQISALQAALDG
jgi:hypothetical protein